MVSTDGERWKRSCGEQRARGGSIAALRVRHLDAERRAARACGRCAPTRPCSASARSSCRLTIWLTLTPGAGWSSNTVMTGPGLMPSIVPSTPNSAQRCVICSPRRISSASSSAFASSCRLSRLTGGSDGLCSAGSSATNGIAFCGVLGLGALGTLRRSSAAAGCGSTRRMPNWPRPSFSSTRTGSTRVFRCFSTRRRRVRSFSGARSCARGAASGSATARPACGPSSRAARRGSTAG